MENQKNQLLDEEELSKSRRLTDNQLASIIQSKVRYPSSLISKIEDEIDRRNLSKYNLINQTLLPKNENTLKENFTLFYKKNKIIFIILLLLSPFPWGSLIIIFSIYFSLKRFSI